VSKLELILLGHFDCLLPSGKPVSLPMRKAEVLLAYLALSPGIRHPRERLINLLWSDRGEEQARNSLRQCLSAIKKSLGDAAELVLEVDRTTVRLIPELVEVDALEFERLAGDLEFESLSDAAGLYRGEFLEGISIRDTASQEWLDSERARFKRQYVEILANLGETQLASRDYRHAIQTFERLVVQDPLNESGWRRLMTAYHGNGDRSHALQAYKRCQQLMRSELDVEPEAETLELREQIVGGTVKPRSKPEIATAAPAAKSREASTSGDHSIAVLPFDNLSGDPEQEYFSDGITDSIILNLSLFPDLQVKSRYSSFAFKEQIKNIGEISEELNVDYVVEGSIRRSVDRIRITVQLIEVTSGNQVWGKRYDENLENLFDLEEELSRTIAATVTGQIESERQRIALTKGAANQQSYDLLLSGIYHCFRFNRSDNVIGIEKLNECLAQDPGNVRALVYLYTCHIMDYLDRWSTDYVASLELSRNHIEEALRLAPELGLVNKFYAEYLVFRGDFDKADKHLDKALEINPNDTDALSIRANGLGMRGEFDVSLQLAEQVCRMDPYHPWAEWELAGGQYNAGFYEAALHTIAGFRTEPDFSWVFAIASHIRLGHTDQAKQALQEFLDACRKDMLSMPQSYDEWFTYIHNFYPYKNQQYSQDLMDCLVKAGLEEVLTLPRTTGETSEHPSILVLPFGNLSGDNKQEYLSDGITESIILALSASSGLLVKSRHTSFAYKNSSLSIDQIGTELGIQYIVEGSVRKHGDQVGVTVQLGEIGSGNQIWGKRYDKPLTEFFALEEELVNTIAGTINGRIDREIKVSSSQSPAQNPQAYDYLMRGWYHGERFTPEDNEAAQKYFGKCIEIDPANTQARTLLASVISVQIYENWCADSETAMAESRQHIMRALEIDPANAYTHAFLAENLLLEKKHEQALYHANRAIELDPSLPDGYSTKGFALCLMGRMDEALAPIEQSLQIDPYHYYMGWNAGCVYRTAGEYRKAIDTFRSIPVPPTSVYAEMAACLVGLGEIDAAKIKMKEYLEIARQQMPNFPASRNEWLQIWKAGLSYRDEEPLNLFFEQLLLAGLCDGINEAPDKLPSIAVLPFKNQSEDTRQEYFSDGITSSLILGLGMFKGLRVRSQNSSFALRNSTRTTSEIASELSADFLIEGSIRKSGDKLRLSAQLVETETDTQIWGKQYEAELADVLELEQELSATIAATISGRIGHRLQQSAVRKSAQSLQSYDYLLRGLYHMGKFTAADMNIAQQQIEKCLELEPDNAEAHMQLGMVHAVSCYENWTMDRTETTRLAGIHLTRALELAPDNALVQAYFGEFLFEQKDYERAVFHANKAIELNPAAAEGYTLKADIMASTRRYEEAIALADHCFRLDPNSVGTGWVAGEVYRITGHYEKAIRTLRSIPYPPTTIHAIIAASFAGLGQMEQARMEMAEFHQRARDEMPQVPASRAAWREFWKATSSYQYEQDFEELMSQLFQAGLGDEIEDEQKEMPSIAVLPFENMSGDPEQAFFSDGITTDIISTLSKFRHLRIVARHSTANYKTGKHSIADIATEQNVRYVLGGSVRRSGNRIRVSAELIDAQSEQNCWSERYDRDLDDLFEVQDEVTREITLAMKVHFDDGEMARFRSVGTNNLKAWELIMRAVDLEDTYILQNILEARGLAKQAIALDPGYAFAQVVLAWTYWQEVYGGWSEDPEYSLSMSEKYSQHALELNPDHADALAQAGIGYIMRHEAEKALESGRKAVEIEPGNAENQALLAFEYIFVGDYELARVHERLTRQLCPIMPNWYYLILGQIEFLDGDLDKAIAIFEAGIDMETESTLCRFYLVNALMQKDDAIAAGDCAEQIKALDPAANGSGLVLALSSDKEIREQFHQNLAKFDLA